MIKMVFTDLRNGAAAGWLFFRLATAHAGQQGRDLHGFPYVDAYGRLPDWLDRYQSRYLTASPARTALENSQLFRWPPDDITIICETVH